VSELDDQRAVSGYLEKACAALRAEIKDVRAENERLRAAVWEESHMNDSLRRENERLRAENHCLFETINNARAEDSK
jgi:FtsZ-binding cell division protein ZapB